MNYTDTPKKTTEARLFSPKHYFGIDDEHGSQKGVSARKNRNIERTFEGSHLFIEF